MANMVRTQTYLAYPKDLRKGVRLNSYQRVPGSSLVRPPIKSKAYIALSLRFPFGVTLRVTAGHGMPIPAANS
jgi:hypothetical protein